MKQMKLEQVQRHTVDMKCTDAEAKQLRYVVREVKNSIEVSVGQVLIPTEVEAYCDLDNWTITIT